MSVFSAAYFHLLELILPDGQSRLFYQTLDPTPGFAGYEYKQRLYTDYICLDYPGSPDQITFNTQIEIKIPNISGKLGTNLTRDWLADNAYLRGAVAIFTTIRKDPETGDVIDDWFLKPQPWVIAAPSLNNEYFKFKLVSPTDLIRESGKRPVKGFTSDILLPEIPRTR